jgi:hypothetical protein
LGEHQTNGWQQFSFTFNSLGATSATLTLLNLQTDHVGNDFAVDDILVVGPAAAVPEPPSLALTGVATLAGLGLWARTRRRT